MHPISSPERPTMGCICKGPEENGPCFDDTTLFESLNWVMVMIVQAMGCRLFIDSPLPDSLLIN